MSSSTNYLSYQCTQKPILSEIFPGQLYLGNVAASKLHYELAVCNFICSFDTYHCLNFHFVLLGPWYNLHPCGFGKRAAGPSTTKPQVFVGEGPRQSFSLSFGFKWFQKLSHCLSFWLFFLMLRYFYLVFKWMHG